jgi:hypothetical protein
LRAEVDVTGAGWHVNFARGGRFHQSTQLHRLGLDPNGVSRVYGGLDQKLVGVEESGK